MRQGRASASFVLGDLHASNIFARHHRRDVYFRTGAGRRARRRVGESRLGFRTWNQRRGLRLADEPLPDLPIPHDNVVAAGGLIAVLDLSNYGPLVIRNAISIVDDGGLAGIAVASGDAIDIQAGPNDAVFLKGLHIDGLGTANNGIHLTSAGKLTIVNCTIKGFGATTPDNGNGIRISVNSGSLDFSVSNTIVSLNSGVGVWLDLNGSSSPTASLKM